MNNLVWSHIRNRLWLILLAFFLSNVYAADSSYLPAVPKDNSRKFYLSGGVITGLEGWTWMHFEIDENGKVQNPLLINQSEKSTFADQAFQLLESIEYEPATLKGVPVASSEFMFLRHARNIGSDQNKSAGDNFAQAYGEVLKAIGNNELQSAESQIQTIKNDFKYNLVRQAWLAWLTAMLNFRQQDYNAYLHNLTIAAHLAEDYLSNTVASKLYMNLFEMQMYSHRYLDAQDSVENMIKSEKVTITDELAKSLLERVNERVESVETYSVELILESGTWQTFRLNKATASIFWSAGTVKGFKLRCNGKNFDYENQIDETTTQFTINEQYVGCVVLFTGDTGKKVTITQ